jgi:hypothetical protein
VDGGTGHDGARLTDEVLDLRRDGNEVRPHFSLRQLNAQCAPYRVRSPAQGIERHGRR